MANFNNNNKGFILDKFPHFKLIKASAGTGKTYILSKRISEFLLSDIANNNLRNILAITFTVNAAKEMKQRVIAWLKNIALSDKETLKNFNIKEKDYFSQKANDVINQIFLNYKDFQIKTIDSFLTSIFKACSVDFGFPEDFKVALNNKEYLKSAFNNYLNTIDSLDHNFIKIVEFINESDNSFKFDPLNAIFNTIRKLYVKQRHYSTGFVNKDRSEDFKKIKQEISKLIAEIQSLIYKHGITISGKCGLIKMIEDINKDDYQSFFERGDKATPIKKEDVNANWANELLKLWEELKDKKLQALYLYSENYYYPYIWFLGELDKILKDVKAKEEVVFIEDIPSIILKNVGSFTIPDVYIKLGGRLYHHFIDEFQDTSPIQWANLKEFIDNSLAQGGSLFIVGDTKQAIYGFRDTDYEIMNSISKECPFESSKESFSVETLTTNFRSEEVILNYAKCVFGDINSQYSENFADSGLFNWDFDVKDEQKNKGYVEAVIIKNDTDTEIPVERQHLKEILEDLLNRGYTYNDIAILAHKNSEIVEISTWLNEEGLPFLSFSSLDIRDRKVIKELIYLLKFFDNPRDNFSFAFFLKGEIFKKLCPNINIDHFIFMNKNTSFLYKAFCKEYPQIWETSFKAPFNYVGYLPIYELVISIINSFKITENFENETGAIAKLLEILKDLESNGNNSLKEFLEFLDSHEEDVYESSRIFELSIPQNANAIKLMTVHKAKGLGFPVVIYFLYGSNKNRSESIKIYETTDGLKIFKLTQKMANDTLAEIYYNINKKEKINELNSIYVGLTRAQQELYLLGIVKDNKTTNEKLPFPVDLIKVTTMGYKHTLQNHSKTETKNSSELKISFSQNLKIQRNFKNKIAFEEKQRGEFIHLILSKIDHLNDFTIQSIAEIFQKLSNVSFSLNLDKISKEILDFLANNEIAAFFQIPDAKVYVEKEFVSAEYGTIRIDRLIIKPEKAIIVDFKTGEKDNAYNAQLEKYAKVVKEIYDKHIECFILYLDKKEAIKVYEC